MNNLDSKKILEMYARENSRSWKQIQDGLMLKLFRKASESVSAYKKFLKDNRIHVKVNSADEIYSSVPAINKQNYFHKNNFRELAENRYFEKSASVITSTSGSTGKPTYFPRTDFIDWQYSVLAEFFIKNGKPGSTLLINCFGMGVWIGGVITYQAFYDAGLRGNPISIITPGIKKEEIFSALKQLAPQYDNVILSGYPPFIKDIIDEAPDAGVDWNKFNARVLFAAESFSEEFRDYICKKAKIKNPLTDTLNIYGSAELGAMAFETPTAIFIRRLALKHQQVYDSIFDHHKLPTFAQYNPLFVIFSARNGEVLISADNVFPMVNYKIGDSGGVYTFDQITDKFSKFGINLEAEAKKAGIALTRMPFVYVYERSDFTVSFYGANIFPQHIKHALYHKNASSKVTGKFTMEVKRDKKHDEMLEINIEMAKGVKPTAEVRKKLTAEIIKHLVQLNSEYENNYKLMPKRTVPKLRLWQHGHQKYFAPGIKQKWKI